MTEQIGTNTNKLIAILRGVRPQNVIEVAETLISVGIISIEIPLNSPSPLHSIEKLVNRFGDVIQVGAGTVLQADQVKDIKTAGAVFFLTPNVNPAVIQKSVELNLPCFAGFATPSEAFTALSHGVHGLKLFPASHFGTDYLHAIRAVLSEKVPVVAVGGISQKNARQWLSGGADSVGIGSSLFTADINMKELQKRCNSLLEMTREADYA